MSVANTQLVSCPNCGEQMTLRTGKWGQFWSCPKFPTCRGTRKVGEETKEAPKSEYEPMVKLPGSEEQEAIWEHLLHGKSHTSINAGPGVGKTWVSVQACLRLPKTMQILFIAFNKHIAKEAQGKLQASGCYNVQASTFHSWGFGILRSHFSGLKEPAFSKMTDIFEQLEPAPVLGKAEWRRKLNLAEKLANYCKDYLVDYQAADFVTQIEKIADHHGVDMNGSFQHAVDLIPAALDECKKQAPLRVDFGDMCWLPTILNLKPKYPCDLLITDESQDFGNNQHEMVFKAPRYGGRICIVGDKRQSIYGWRSAHTESMDVLTKRLGDSKLGVKEFPLTITRRCPKLHVQLAQTLFPNIQALEDAPLGEILTMTKAKAEQELRVGDMVICRVNKELIHTAYALIQRGIRPMIKGRELGKGLLSLIEKLEEEICEAPHPQMEMTFLSEALNRYRATEIQKLLPLGDKAQGRLSALEDKCDCLLEFILNSTSIADMRSKISQIFEKSDDEGKPDTNCVILGTVHRTKGLESPRVFVLAPELIPHPAARKDWEKQQEKNIAWISCTRAKFTDKEPGTLVFCGLIPPIYSAAPVVPPIERDEEAEIVYEEEEDWNGKVRVAEEFAIEKELEERSKRSKNFRGGQDSDEPPF